MKKILPILLTATLLFACKENNNEQIVKTELSEAIDITGAETVYDLNAATSSIEWRGSKLFGSDYHNGTVQPASASLAFEGTEPIGGTIVIDMTSIANTDLAGDPDSQKKLEGHLKSGDFFGVSEFPTASFAITEISKDAAEGYLVKGNLTIKGITKAIEFPAKITQNEQGAVATASLNIDRSQFDVRFRSTSFAEFADIAKDKVIDDKIELKLNLNLS